MSTVQWANTILKIGFAFSNSPHLQRAYSVAVCNQMLIAVNHGKNIKIENQISRKKKKREKEDNYIEEKFSCHSTLRFLINVALRLLILGKISRGYSLVWRGYAY